MEFETICILLGAVGVAIGLARVFHEVKAPTLPPATPIPPDTTTLRRVRMAARAMGCNSAQRHMTEAYASGLMARGEPRGEVEEMARVFAGDLLQLEAERRSLSS
jgi:hypothetical protein